MRRWYFSLTPEAFDPYLSRSRSFLLSAKSLLSSPSSTVTQDRYFFDMLYWAVCREFFALPRLWKFKDIPRTWIPVIKRRERERRHHIDYGSAVSYASATTVGSRYDGLPCRQGHKQKLPVAFTKGVAATPCVSHVDLRLIQISHDTVHSEPRPSNNLKFEIWLVRSTTARTFYVSLLTNL